MSRRGDAIMTWCLALGLVAAIAAVVALCAGNAEGAEMLACSACYAMLWAVFVCVYTGAGR